MKMPPVQLLFFEIFEKTFHNGIVIGMPFPGKGRNHVEGIQFFPEIGRGKLSASVGMEHDALRNASVSDSIPESMECKEPIQAGADPVGNDPPGKQVQNDAEITEPLANPDIGKVADPDQIGSRLIKLLGKQILERLGDIRLFRRSGRFDSRHFGEIHFFHQPVHPTFADGYAKITCKTKPDFPAAQALTGFGVDLQDFLPDALIFLFSGRWLPVYVAVIGAAVDVEYPAKNGDTVLAGKRPDSF